MTHYTSPPGTGVSATGLRQYRVAGVHEILWAAATEIEVRGDIARGVHYDPSMDLVDAEGALAIAAGAPTLRLLRHDDDLIAVVPPARQAAVALAIEAMEGWFGEDLTAWSDARLPQEVAAGLRYVADKVNGASPKRHS